MQNYLLYVYSLSVGLGWSSGRKQTSLLMTQCSISYTPYIYDIFAMLYIIADAIYLTM